MPVVTLTHDDIGYAMGIVWAHKDDPYWFGYDIYSWNSPNFSKEEFRTATIKSLALESHIKRFYSIPRRSMEDFKPDLPNGVEVSIRATKNRNGGPYLVERRDGFHPTLTAVSMTTSERDLDIRYLVTPDMRPKLHIIYAWSKASGVTRHLISRESAEEAGACKDIMQRLRVLVLGR